MKAEYKATSINLRGAVAMGTGVMINAGILAPTVQIAELARPWFPLSFVVATVTTAFSAYTCIKMRNAYALLFAVFLVLSYLVVGCVAATAPGSANEQQVAAVTAHPAQRCYQSGQKTHHAASGTQVTCAFCVPIPQSSELVALPTTGSEIFLQDFNPTLGRNVAPEQFPPKINSTA